MEKKNKIIFAITLGIIFLFLLVFGSGNFVSPFYGDINLIDEGQFASWLSRMNLGGHLYKDTYAAYGPFYIYPLYLSNLFFGPSIFLIRIVYGVISVFFAILIVLSVFKKLKISILFQILPIFLLVFLPAFGMRQGIGLLTILLVYISFEKNKLIWGFLSGLSLASSFLIGIDTGIFTFFVCSFLIIFKLITSKNIKAILKNLFAIILGTLILFFVFFIWSYHEGWFSYYLKSIVDDLTIYSGINLPIGQRNISPLEVFRIPFSLPPLLKFIFSKGILIYWLLFFYLLIFLFLIVKLILGKSKKEDLLVFAIFLFGFLLSTILIGRNGHFSYTASPAFVLFGYILSEINYKYRISKNLMDKFVLIAIIFSLFIFSERLILIHRPNFYLLFEISKTIFKKSNNPKYVGNTLISSTQKNSLENLRKYVERNVKPNEDIFFFSNEPMMYLVINRKNPNRFDLPEVASIKEKRLEILDSLKKNKTKYVIEDTMAWSVDGISNRQRLPEVYEYILRNYTRRSYGQYIIYKLREN